MGSSVPLSPRLCNAIRQLLKSSEQNPAWSRRAVERIVELRQDLSVCCGEGSIVMHRGVSLEWWTFGGMAANQTVVQYLQPHVNSPLRADNLWINLPSDLSIDHLNQIIQELPSFESPPDWDLRQPAADLLKFGDLLPDHLLRDLVLARIGNVPLAREILRSPIRVVDCP